MSLEDGQLRFFRQTPYDWNLTRARISKVDNIDGKGTKDSLLAMDTNIAYLPLSWSH